jgi:hypothetical protein
MLTAGLRDQFLWWRRSWRRLSVYSVLRCPNLWLQFSVSFVQGLRTTHHTRIMYVGGTDSLWKLDACVKAGVLVDLVCLKTTLKECVRSYSQVLASQWQDQAGNRACQKLRSGRCCLSCYVFKPYKMRLVLALTPVDKVKRREFWEEMHLKMEKDSFAERLIVSDYAIFHISSSGWQRMLSPCSEK